MNLTLKGDTLEYKGYPVAKLIEGGYTPPTIVEEFKDQVKNLAYPHDKTHEYRAQMILKKAGA